MTSQTTEEQHGPEGDGPRKRRGPYAKSAVTRQRILDVARDIFSTLGYNGTSLRTIADRVGMTVPGVLHHFGSKEQMLIAVLADRDQNDREFVASVMSRPGTSPVDALRELARRQTDDIGMLRLITVLAAEALDPEHPAHDFFLERNAALLESGRRMFDAASADGGISADADRGAMVLVITALFEGMALQWLRNPTIDLEQTIDHFTESSRWFTADRASGQPG